MKPQQGDAQAQEVEPATDGRIARFPVRIELRFEERQPCNVIEGPHEAADHGEETLFTAGGPGVEPVQRSKPQ